MSKETTNQRTMSSPNARAPNGAPERDLSRLWNDLNLRDRTSVQLLETIVRCIRLDGTASVADVVWQFREANREHARVAGGSDASVIGADRQHAEPVTQLIERLAHAELISLPKGGITAPGAAISISNPSLRLALLEAGLIQLDEADLAPEPPRAVKPSSVRAARRPPDVAHAASDEWSQLWFAIERNPWTTLAIVPASRGESGMLAAGLLAQAGRRYGDSVVELVDASGVTPEDVDQIVTAMYDAAIRGAKVLVAVDCPLSNPAAIPITRSAGMALLAVSLGVPTLAESQRALDAVGRGYFIGSVAVRPSKRRAR